MDDNGEESQFTQIWADTFAKYQRDTDRDIKTVAILKDLNSTEDLLGKLDEGLQHFENYRHHKKALWDTLSTALKPVELLGNMTQGALTLTPFSPASQVFGAVLYFVNSAKNVSSAYDTITNLLGKVEEFTRRLRVYSEVEIGSDLKRIIVEILASLLMIFARSEKLIERGRWKQYFSVTFLGSDGKTAGLLDRLNDLTENERSMVAALTLSTAKRTEQGVGRTEQGVERTEKGVERTQRAVEGVVKRLTDSKKEKKEEEDRKLLKEALESDALKKVLNLYHELEEKRLPGSGDWVLQETLFEAWEDREAPLLWILGGPGVGKTYLSTRIIHYLKDTFPQEKDHPGKVSVGYFYIREDDQQLHSVNTILKSIASQIARNDSVYRSYAVNVFNSPDNVRTAKGTWKKLYIDFFSSTQNGSSAYITLDGLDEAPVAERELLLELLADLAEPQGKASVYPRVQIVLVGRPNLQNDMQNVWGDRTIRIRKSFIEVSAKRNAKDILDYINAGIKKVRLLKKLQGKERRELREEIIEKLTDQANGMFMWVKLMLEDIYRKTRKSEIKAVLSHAPPDLHKMIRHVFERLASDPDVKREDLNELLCWVALSERPLLLGELGVALKLVPPVGEGVLTLEDDLRQQYASFFTLTREDGKTTEGLQEEAEEELIKNHEGHNGGKDDDPAESDDEDGPLVNMFQSPPRTTDVRFSHTCIRDYLRREGVPADIGIGVDMDEGQKHLALTCLSILCDKDHSTTYPAPNLQGYAAANFMKHLAQVDRSRVNKEDARKIVRLLVSLFNDIPALDRWRFKIGCWDFDEFVKAYLTFEEPSKPIREWFIEEDSLSQLSYGDRTWAQKATSSVMDFFKPLALSVAGGWLKDREVGPEVEESYVVFLHYYLLLREQKSGADTSDAKSQDLVWLSDLSADRIRTCAKFAGFEESSFWHCRLATALREAGYVDEAIAESHISIGMDNQNWLAMGGLGIALSEQEKYSEAIEWELKALNIIPADKKEDQGYFWVDISICRRALRDSGGAIQASKEACAANPNNVSVITEYIYALDAAARPQEIMTFVEGLDKDYLTKVLAYYPDASEVIANAARAAFKLGFITDAYEKAVTAAVRKGFEYNIARARQRLATLYFRQVEDEDKALGVWEHLLNTLPRKNTDNFWSATEIREVTSDALSEMYFAKAMAAEKQGSDPSPWITKLSALAMDKGSGSDSDVLSTTNASLVFGLWHRLHDQHDKAKACFKAMILDDVTILTDTDPNNDIGGYMGLAQTLLMAGDMENSEIAFSITNSPLDRLKAKRDAEKKASERPAAGEAADISGSSDIGAEKAAPTATSGAAMGDSKSKDAALPMRIKEAAQNGTDTEEFPATETEAPVEDPDDPLVNTFMWECDGPCMTDPVDWEALYFCGYCIGTCFCDQCFELLKTDKMPYRKCDKNHEFFQGYPVKDADRMKAMATVKGDNGRLEPNTEWLSGLRKTWGCV